jgi:hypothetical protein
MNDLVRGIDTNTQASSAERLAGAIVEDRQKALSDISANFGTQAHESPCRKSLS